MRKLLEIDLPWEFDSTRALDIPCLICGGKGRNIGSVILNKAGLWIKKCGRDGLMWLSPRPPQSFYDELYDNHFYNSTCQEQYGYATIDDEDRRKEKAGLNWDDIERESPVKLNGGSFLEIGCATGEMLGEAIARGWKRVRGNELSKEAVSRCRELGYDIIEGDYSAIRSDFPFELIFADNVIEHLMNPLHFIRHVSGLLSENGMLCLRLPDTPEDGPRLKLIDHTYHFNENSLGLLLNKGGLKILKRINSGIYHGSGGNFIQNMTVFCTKSDK